MFLEKNTSEKQKQHITEWKIKQITKHNEKKVVRARYSTTVVRASFFRFSVLHVIYSYLFVRFLHCVVVYVFFLFCHHIV